MELEVLAVVGPTASGKTRRAVELAKFLDGEIISGDSRQIYRGMTIGTGKDLDEYGDVAYHLIDIVDAGYKYNLHQYLRDFDKVRADICHRGHLPILCGGSGMYVENALAGIKMPEVPTDEKFRKSFDDVPFEELVSRLRSLKKLHNTTDIDTKQRAIRALEIADYYSRHPEEAIAGDRQAAKPLRSLIIGIEISREERRQRISRRLDERLRQGMVEEVERLLAQGIPPEDLIYYGLEYKYVTLYLTGEKTYVQMHDELEIAIHQFAKRQMTWFRGMEKRGFKINWLPYDISQPDFVMAVKKMIDFAV